eukprot:1161578-Pelagomonas_calceolata.AAC.6
METWCGPASTWECVDFFLWNPSSLQGPGVRKLEGVGCALKPGSLKKPSWAVQITPTSIQEIRIRGYLELVDTLKAPGHVCCTQPGPGGGA